MDAIDGQLGQLQEINESIKQLERGEERLMLESSEILRVQEEEMRYMRMRHEAQKEDWDDRFDECNIEEDVSKAFAQSNAIRLTVPSVYDRKGGSSFVLPRVSECNLLRN